MSKILIYADPHWCKTSSILRGYSGDKTMRLHLLIQSLSWVEEEAMSRGCDTILCLGDFFDRASLDAEEITALRELKFSPSIKHWFLVGNHDAYNADNSVSATNLFCLMDGVTVFSQPTTITEGTTELCMLPYTRDTKSVNLERLFGSWDSTKTKRYIFSHNDIMGIQYGGIVTTFGIPIEDLSRNCTYCFNGHIHNRGMVTDNVCNVGNLTGLNFSEDGFKYKHVAMILDADSGEITTVDNPYAVCFYKSDFRNDNYNVSFPPFAVVSATCYSDSTQRVRELLEAENVLVSRIVSFERETVQKDKVNIQELLKRDHLKSFYEYVAEHIGTDESTLEEAQKVIGG